MAGSATGRHKATRCRNMATFHLSVLIACRLHSATDHNTQQSGGAEGRKASKRKKLLDLYQTTASLCVAHRQWYSDRNVSRPYFQCVSLCCVPKGYTRFWEGFGLTQVTVAPSLVKEREGCMNNSTSAARLWRLVVLWVGEASMEQQARERQHLLTKRKSHDSPGIDSEKGDIKKKEKKEERTGHHFWVRRKNNGSFA